MIHESRRRKKIFRKKRILYKKNNTHGLKINLTGTHKKIRLFIEEEKFVKK